MTHPLDAPAELTPRRIVEELDRYIIGQMDAKKAVAIAIRNRLRRLRLTDDLRDDVVPKNLILIGPTGVGKTEIARRIANLIDAPFVKVEASKFTEVGYVGRDVESMVRDLVEAAVNIVTEEQRRLTRTTAEELAEQRLLDALLPPAPTRPIAPHTMTAGEELRFAPEPSQTREKLQKMLAAGKLDEREVEIDVEDNVVPTAQIFSNQGVEQMGFDFQSLFERLAPARTKQRKLKVAEARALLVDQEAEKLLEKDKVVREALRRAETSGIIFLDEIDKICRGQGGGDGRGPDVSREGVQRDLLPIIEGSTVNTRYGTVRTDHMLFIAAGAFHVSSPADLIPELQGRFPIRVELASLGRDEFIRILREPRNALTKQYAALLACDGVDVEFTDDALEQIATIAQDVNNRTQDIGARRLHTLFEKLLENPLFDAPDYLQGSLLVDADYVRERLESLAADEDMSRYIL